MGFLPSFPDILPDLPRLPSLPSKQAVIKAAAIFSGGVAVGTAVITLASAFGKAYGTVLGTAAGERSPDPVGKVKNKILGVIEDEPD